MLKMMKRQLSCGWTAWCDVILGIHRQLEAAERERERQDAKRRRAVERMNSSLRRMQTRGLAIGWNTWAGRTRALRVQEAEAQRQKDLMRKVFLHMTHRNLSSGLVAWRTAVHAALEQEKRGGVSKKHTFLMCLPYLQPEPRL